MQDSNSSMGQTMLGSQRIFRSQNSSQMVSGGGATEPSTPKKFYFGNRVLTKTSYGEKYDYIVKNRSLDSFESLSQHKRYQSTQWESEDFQREIQKENTIPQLIDFTPQIRRVLGAESKRKKVRNTESDLTMHRMSENLEKQNQKLMRYMDYLEMKENNDQQRKSNWRECFNNVILRNPYQQQQKPNEEEQNQDRKQFFKKTKDQNIFKEYDRENLIQVLTKEMIDKKNKKFTQSTNYLNTDETWGYKSNQFLLGGRNSINELDKKGKRFGAIMPDDPFANLDWDLNNNNKLNLSDEVLENLQICQNLIEKICQNMDILYKKSLNKKKMYNMLENYMRFKYYALKPFVDEKKLSVTTVPDKKLYWSYLLDSATIKTVKERIIELNRQNKEKSLGTFPRYIKYILIPDLNFFSQTLDEFIKNKQNMELDQIYNAVLAESKSILKLESHLIENQQINFKIDPKQLMQVKQISRLDNYTFLRMKKNTSVDAIQSVEHRLGEFNKIANKNRYYGKTLQSTCDKIKDQFTKFQKSQKQPQQHSHSQQQSL